MWRKEFSFRLIKTAISGSFYLFLIRSLAADDFSREALFFLMTPVLAALSMALYVLASSLSASLVSVLATFCSSLTADL